MGTLRTNWDGHQTAFSDGFFAKHGHTRIPLLVQWMVTTQCGLHCPHCLTGRAAPPTYFSQRHSTEVLDEIADLDIPEVLLTGGEPLELPWIEFLIKELHARSLRWSLNTARLPPPRVQRVMECWPPCFVAVSLDGPPAVHDRFRGRRQAWDEAMAAVAYFAELSAGNTAVGTTVTSLNFRHLTELLPWVVRSGARGWGLHLVVPEGRAAHRPDLQLNRHQLRQLLEFVASKRTCFPITLADEIGYCGEWEPMVRDAPFFCGAGRAQCVILPNGEVVPCTTLDTTTSAGNVMREPLRDIWSRGFGELRSAARRDSCAGCDYHSACRGGCWLQNRLRQRCSRWVWDRPNALSTAASVAVCLGLAACRPPFSSPSPSSAPAIASGEPPATVASPVPASSSACPGQSSSLPTPVPSSDVDLDRGRPKEITRLEWALLEATIGSPDSVCSPDGASLLRAAAAGLGADPGANYLEALARGECPNELSLRAARVALATKSCQHSVLLISWLWRDLSEAVLSSPKPYFRRAEEERRALREAHFLLERVALQWRQEAFERRMDPFLFPDEGTRRVFMSKAGPPPWARTWQRVGERRWGQVDVAAITRQYLQAHPVAESMRLEFTPIRSGPSVQGVSGTRRPSTRDWLGAFEVLSVPAGQPVEIKLGSGTQKLSILLEPEAEATWMDIARVAQEQHPQSGLPQEPLDSFPEAFWIPWLRQSFQQGELDRLASAWLF